MNAETGKRNWVFCDGDLPPKDSIDLDAHEALMVVNLNNEIANLSIDVIFYQIVCCTEPPWCSW
jgi:hypothetical protein